MRAPANLTLITALAHQHVHYIALALHTNAYTSQITISPSLHLELTVTAYRDQMIDVMMLRKCVYMYMYINFIMTLLHCCSSTCGILTNKSHIRIISLYF